MKTISIFDIRKNKEDYQNIIKINLDLIKQLLSYLILITKTKKKIFFQSILS